MTNKIVIVSAVALGLGAASLALASGAAVPVAPVYFDGWYAGLGAGVQHVTGSSSHSIHEVFTPFSDLPRQAPTVSDYSFYNDMGNTTLDGGIFFGYGQVFNTSYYVGGELFGRYAHATVDSVNTFPLAAADRPITEATSSLNVNTKLAYGADVRLGFLPSDKTLIYAVLGVESAKFDCHAGLSSADGFIDHGYDFDKQAVAFMPGVGIETMLTNRISLRGQYTYADFASFSHSDYFKTEKVVQRDLVDTYEFTSTDKIDPARGLFTLDLTYRWNGV